MIANTIGQQSVYKRTVKRCNNGRLNIFFGDLYKVINVNGRKNDE